MIQVSAQEIKALAAAGVMACIVYALYTWAITPSRLDSLLSHIS